MYLKHSSRWDPLPYSARLEPAFFSSSHLCNGLRRAQRRTDGGGWPSARRHPRFSMQDCAVRVQNPDDRTRGGDPQHPERSSIPPQMFTHTVSQVNTTISDYNNDRGQNVALWLDGDYALRYAGIDRRLRGVERMVPQPNLATPNAHVTPSAECQSSMEAGGATVAAYGLNGRVEEGEIYGIMVPAIQDATANHNGFIELWYPDPNNPNGPPQLRAVLDLFSRSDLRRFLGTRFQWQWGGSPM
ncbi:hypothetical protein A0H81_10079 [Grifola frondosa]|uniref:Uncharacterized protein n=1 Tax=Grifola frondosa TaxID=5627 RepID=A0A1C7M090_GRIFR|nr:hypothetical protein A0H81_10079 [Grifola frondosa]